MQQVRKTFILKNQAAAADDLGWMGSGAVRRAHVHTRRIILADVAAGVDVGINLHRRIPALDSCKGPRKA
ncbi:hypothetical protein Csa_018943 [Cucumis sativus]|uniref:Uncharacterized protein n=1 Tax=Cucumis sativus TaxID=3659 RepID=A0A0A0KGS7_CUCSA|nr:hypothetical protein Csa_018943 [Cucumis sativus]